MNWTIIIGIVLAVAAIAALVLLSKRSESLGSEKAYREQAEKIAKERSEDAKIAAEPFTDRPFDGLRKRKK